MGRSGDATGGGGGNSQDVALTDGAQIQLTLPWPPTANTYWRRNGGRYFISAAGQRFRRRVAEVAVIEGLQTKLGGRIRMQVTCYPPDRRKRDLGNLDKSLADALEHAGVIEDDSLIDDLRYRRYWNYERDEPVMFEGGLVEVMLSEIARGDSD